MNLIIAMLILSASPKEPVLYYYNGKSRVKLHTIEMPSVGHTSLRFLVYSPYELRDARVDSFEVEACLPEYSVRRDMHLEGRWYMITWNTRLKTGSQEHTIYLDFYHRKVFSKRFFVHVEGTKRVTKPTGVN